MANKHYKYLEDSIPDRHLNKYLEVSSQLRQPTASVLTRTLDISCYLNKQQLKDDYVLFGGYAVLSHIMQQYGEDSAISWRGSEDIDIACTEAAVRSIKRGYKIVSDRPSPNLRDKRTLKLREDDGTDCKIDLYTGNFEGRFFPPEINKHFGIELRVSNPFSLIRGKLITPKDQFVHSTDIVRLLAVLERREYDPLEISRHFPAEQKEELKARMKEGIGLISHGVQDDDVVPSGEFITEMYRCLHKAKNVR